METNRRDVTMLANKADGGPFAPLVRATRGVVGTKDFNKLRGKAISLHSQVRSKDCCGPAACNIGGSRVFAALVQACPPCYTCTSDVQSVCYCLLQNVDCARTSAAGGLDN